MLFRSLDTPEKEYIKLSCICTASAPYTSAPDSLNFSVLTHSVLNTAYVKHTSAVMLLLCCNTEGLLEHMLQVGWTSQIVLAHLAWAMSTKEGPKHACTEGWEDTS